MSGVTHVLRGLPVPDAGTVVTVGTFDGVHRGHMDVLAQLVARARARDVPSLVITFDPHPLQIVRPEMAPPLLTTFHEKLEVIAQAGVCRAAVLPFTPGLAALSAESFVDEVLLARFGMCELLVGHDHGFGRGRLGDINVLRAMGQDRGFAVTVLEPVAAADGVAVSSTSIRRAIQDGDLKRAAELLGRPFSVSGRVVGGERRGRLLGFPTINLEPTPSYKLLPPDGVYAVRVQTPQGEFGGMLNLGPRPTFGELERRIETHILDASHDWYGALVRLDFVSRLRGTQAFADADALKAQLGLDEVSARHILGLAAR